MGEKGFFSYLPISLFGSVMGLCGFSVALREASFVYLLPSFVSNFVALLAVVAFLAMFLAYALKILTSYKSFLSEFQNQLSKSFFGTFIISLLLLPLVIYEYLPKFAFFLWVLGVVLMFAFAVYLVSFWIQTKHELSHITPAWIIPVVGTLDIPLASSLFEINLHYLNLLALSIGLFWTLPIVTLILSRVVFFEKLPQKLMPTLMILVAPFSVGFAAYLATFGKIDSFAFSLYFLGLFMFFALVSQLFKIASCCPFKVSWWAISFPLAALLNSTLQIAKFLNNAYFDAFGVILLFSCSLVFIWLIFRTLGGIFNKELANLS